MGVTDCIDAAGPTALATHRTDSRRLAAHAHVARCSAADYFGTPSIPPAGCRLRHVAFAVSTFGSLGPDAQALLEPMARTAGPAVPRALSGEFTWSASSFVRFARQAVTMELRRSLAMSLRGLEPAAASRCIQVAAPPQGPPPGPDSMFDVFHDPSGAAVPLVAAVVPPLVAAVHVPPGGVAAGPHAGVVCAPVLAQAVGPGRVTALPQRRTTEPTSPSRCTPLTVPTSPPRRTPHDGADQPYETHAA
eukprot:788264-Prymnesium_polylepis.1